MSEDDRKSVIIAGIDVCDDQIDFLERSGFVVERVGSIEDLKESERRYRTLFNSMTEGFALHEIICDTTGAPVDYRFLDMNPAFEHLTGLNGADLIGQTMYSVLPGNDSVWVQRYGRVALTGEPIHFDNYSAPLNRHYDVYAYRPAPGQFAVIFTDITDRKQAEQLLEEARAELARQIAELKSFTSNLSDGVTRFAADGRIVWMNDMGREILRLPPDEDISDWISRFRLFTLDDQMLPVDQTAAARAVRGERVVDFRFKFLSSRGDMVVLSASASPILDHQGRVIGATSTFRDQTERVAFENDKQRMLDREQLISLMLQETLIPQQIPARVAGCDFAARYVAALDEPNIGGDFYDVFDVGNDRVAVLIGDVAGKGVAAAMQVSAARYAFRSYAYIESSPARVVTLVNDALCKDRDRRIKMLSAFFAIINPRNGTIEYANAGHEPPVIRRGDRSIKEMDSDGMVLGVAPGYEYPQEICSFDYGDLMLLITDGITEARSEQRGMLGKSGVMQFLAADDSPPSVLVDRLIEKAKEYGNGRLLDDVAIIAVAQQKSHLESE